MRTAITALAIALAGLTPNLLAQAFTGEVILNASEQTIQSGESFNISVVVDDNAAPFSGVWFFNILAEATTGAVGVQSVSSLIIDPEMHPGFFTDAAAGELTQYGATALGGQLDFQWPLEQPLNGATVFTFQVQTVAGYTGVIEYSSSRGFLSPNDALLYMNNGEFPAPPGHYNEIIFGSATVNVVPSPPSLAGVLGCLILTISRRRR